MVEEITQELYLVKVKHRYDEDWDVLGIFEYDSDILSAKTLFLREREERGLDPNDFVFSQSKYKVGYIYY